MAMLEKLANDKHHPSCMCKNKNVGKFLHHRHLRVNLTCESRCRLATLPCVSHKLLAAADALPDRTPPLL